MSLARVHTWIAGEVLTASDLNAEFNNILNNALSLISPLTSTLNFNGNQATNLRLEVQSATQSVAAEGVIYWQSTEDAIHVSTGSAQARVPALVGIQQGELVGITNPSGVSGATVFSRIQLDSTLSLSGTALSVGTVSAARGGTGIDTSAAATGSLLYTSSGGTWAVLAPGSASQYLTVIGGVPNWSTIAAQRWAKVDGNNGSLLAGSGVAKSAREGTGEYRVDWSTPFASTNYAVTAIAYGGGGNEIYTKLASGTPYLTTGVFVSVRNQNGTAVDASGGVVTVVAVG